MLSADYEYTNFSPQGASLCVVEGIDQISPCLPRQSSARNKRDRCTCGAGRIECKDCREDWVDNAAFRVRSVFGRCSGKMLWGRLSIPTAPDAWSESIGALWRYWKRIGQVRTNDRRSKSPSGLEKIEVGMAAMHWLNKRKEWSPHLHVVMAVKRGFKQQSLIHFWESMTGGSAELERPRTLAAVVRYSIKGQLPAIPADRMELAKLIAGQRQVRYIGRVNTFT